MTKLELMPGSIMCPDFKNFFTSSKRWITLLVDFEIHKLSAVDYNYDYSKFNIVFNSTASYDLTASINNSTGNVQTIEKNNKVLQLINKQDHD